MPRSLPILVVLVLFSLVVAEIAAEVTVGPRLAQFLSSGEEAGRLPRHASLRRSDGAEEETTAVWVLFTSKCGSLPSDHGLKPAALARRAKHGYGISEEDRPICVAYKIAIEEALKQLSFPVSLRRESKWLNGASYTMAIRDLERAVGVLKALPFVSELEIVGRMIRPTEPTGEVNSATTQSAEDRAEIFRSETEKMEVEHMRKLKRADGRKLERKRNAEAISNKEVMRRNMEESNVLSYGDSFGQLDRIAIPALHQMGLNGSGVIIAVLDTGFNSIHESLRDLTVLGAYDFVYNDTNVADEGGETTAANHGTGTWSNIGGRMPGKLYGGSYGASFVLCKTEDTRSETSTEEDNFVRAIEFSEGFGTDILSASLGYNGWLSWAQLDGQHSIIARAGKRAIDLGMLFVVANGNAGESGIGTPADMERVLSLGALMSNNNIASFSSRGPTSDGRIKPEVSAPGVGIKVAKWNDPTGYSYLAGTSFATPLTAGVAGLLLQSHPSWTNMQLRDAIIYSATPSGTSPNIVYGWGIVNAVNANNYNPSVASAALCTSPYGSWDDSTQSCLCNAGYYNTNCRTEKLTCKQWCPGICGTDGVCYCSGAQNRCNRNSIITANPWTCTNTLYNDGATCNCNCGLYDPDCNIPNAPVVGCATSEASCFAANNRSVCAYTPSEPTSPSGLGTPDSDAAPSPTAPAKKDSHFGILASIALAVLTLFVR